MKKRFLTLALFIPLFWVFYQGNFKKNWMLWFSDSHEIQFTDLRLVTSNATCFKNIPNFDLNFNSCDPWNRILNYPRSWVKLFAYLNLTDNRAFVIGILISAFFILSLIFVTNYLTSNKFNLIQGICILLALNSPPIWMALERANIDIIIFSFLILALAVLVSESKLLTIIGIFILTFASNLKIFPIGSFFALLKPFSRRNFKTNLIALLVIIAISFGTFFNVRADLERIFVNSPSYPNVQFGIRTLISQLNGCLENRSWGLCETNQALEQKYGFILQIFLTSIFIILMVLIPSIRKAIRSVSIQINSQIKTRQGFLIFSGSYLVAFLAGANFYYRLIFLIPIIIILSNFLDEVSISINILILISFYSFGGDVFALKIFASTLQQIISILITFIIYFIFLEDSKLNIYKKESLKK